MKCVVAAVALFHLTGAQPANAQIAWTVAPFYDSNATDFSKTKLMIKDERNGVIRQMYDESHAVLIIQGQYRGRGFNPVPNQARSSENLLRARLEKLGFHVLVWRDLSGRQLKDVFSDIVANLGYRENSRLFFYYFGHGRVMGSPDDAAGTRGFLVPVDAPDLQFDRQGFLSRAMPMSQVLEYAKQMTLKHAFFAFEACHAGKIFEAIATLGGEKPPNPQGYLFQNDIQKPVRQFLTAGNASQEVPADGSFTRLLDAALSATGGNADGYVTGDDVIRYVTRQLPQYATIYPLSPESGKVPGISNGDMIFGQVAEVPQPLAAAAVAMTPNIQIVRSAAANACANSVLAKNKVKDGSVGLIGIDITHHVSVTDWNAVAKSGVSFVYLKASEGTKFKDGTFKANWKAAGEAGLLRGAYHFFDQRPEAAASDQVRNFLSAFDGLTFGPCDLPPVMDWEWQFINPASGFSKENLYPVTDQTIANAQAILESLEQAFRLRPIIYTVSSYWQDAGMPAGFEQYRLWVADYRKAATSSGAPRLLEGRSGYVFWQDTENFVVPGIKGSGKNGGVDRSMFNGTAAELKALTR